MRTGELYQRYNGLYLGTVVSTDDPENLGRVRLKMDQYEDSTDEPVWASVSRPVASSDETVFFTPRMGDQVIVGFLVGDVNEPMILGYAHSQKQKPPDSVSITKHGVVTSIGRVTFDETLGRIEVVLAVAGVELGSVTMDALGVRIESKSQISLAAPLVTVAAGTFGVAATPSFAPMGGALPTLDTPPSTQAVLDFGNLGLEIKTFDSQFCVNEKQVVLGEFLSQVFNFHTHGISSPTVTGPPVIPADPTDTAQATVCAAVEPS